MGLGFSIHLVDQVTGESVAGRDDWADRQHGFWFFGPRHTPLYRQWLELAIPPQAPANRALWVVLTLWRKERGAFESLAVLNSDQQMLNDKQVVLGELVVPAVSAVTSSVPLANFDNGFALDAVDLPERARARRDSDYPSLLGAARCPVKKTTCSFYTLVTRRAANGGFTTSIL